MSSGYVKNVAFVRPASVYNIMKEYDLVHKWAKNEGEAKKKGFDQPVAPHEQWHTDIWTGVLCENMEGINIELLVARVKEKMAQWINFYNNGRLHGALLYLTPADYFEGRKESRLAERREKLHTADINRKAYWLHQQQA